MVEHWQRIISQMHVQPRKRAPRSTDQIKRQIALDILPPRFREHILDSSVERAPALASDGRQAQHAERQGNTIEHCTAPHANKLEAAAAKITDDAVGVGNRGNDAVSGCAGFILAAEQFDYDAPRCRRLDECGTVACIADGRCRHGSDCGDLHGVGHGAKPRQPTQRDGDSFGIKRPPFFEAAAQPCGHFFVEDRGGGTTRATINNQAYRI